MDATIAELAAVAQGEAGLCSVTAMLVILHLWLRDVTMYGHQEPGPQALWVASHLDRLWNPLPTARHAFSAQDMEREVVQRIAAKYRRLFVFY